MKYEYLNSDSLTIKGFSRMPNVLFLDPLLKELSNDSKILITVLLDFALQSNLIDESKHPYVLYSTKKIMETLNISKNTVTKRLDELENAGLIVCPDRKKGKERFRIYVMDFFHASTSTKVKTKTEESQNLGNKITNTGKEESQNKGCSSNPNIINSNFPHQ